MKPLPFPGRKLRTDPAGLPQLYPWRAAEAHRQQVRLAQIAAMEALAGRRGVRALRVVQPVDSYEERARAAQRRGFETFMTRRGGGHLY